MGREPEKKEGESPCPGAGDSQGRGEKRRTYTWGRLWRTGGGGTGSGGAIWGGRGCWERCGLGLAVVDIAHSFFARTPPNIWASVHRLVAPRDPNSGRSTSGCEQLASFRHRPEISSKSRIAYPNRGPRRLPPLLACRLPGTEPCTRSHPVHPQKSPPRLRAASPESPSHDDPRLPSPQFRFAQSGERAEDLALGPGLATGLAWLRVTASAGTRPPRFFFATPHSVPQPNVSAYPSLPFHRIPIRTPHKL